MAHSPAQTVVATTGTPNEVSSRVERVGNPFIRRFPNTPFVRNLWDMAVFKDRLYFGHGNSDNDPPGGNAGPIEVWYYDAAANEFAFDNTLDEEQIDKFVIFDDTLFIPGHDYTGGFGSGYVYLYRGGTWRTWELPVDTAHVYDLYPFEGQYFAALGRTSQDGQVLASTIDGRSWTTYLVPDTTSLGGQVFGLMRAWQLFSVNNLLYLNVSPLSRFDQNGFTGFGTYVYRLRTEGNTPVVESSPIDLFATVPETTELVDTDFEFLHYRILRPIQYADQAVYITGWTTSDHSWTPYGLYSWDGEHAPTAYTFETGETPWDLVEADGVLYILLAKPETPNQWQIRVVAACNFSAWREALRFKSSTFARSFEIYNRDFYFGLGTGAVNSSAASGDILRVSKDFAVMGCV